MGSTFTRKLVLSGELVAPSRASDHDAFLSHGRSTIRYEVLLTIQTLSAS